ncbi:MAG: phage baseplate assembly protein V [Verrucomicrobiota bacterium]|nr:phage baseplate assembly protein V [Verrucomicrobiota bacterium]
MSLAYEILELQRRMANMLRIGVIEEIDYTTAKARVRIGALLTDWLPWTTPRAGGDRDWMAPEIGDQVTILAPMGDLSQAYISQALYSVDHPANGNTVNIRRTTFEDGAFVEYDRTLHRYTVSVPGGGAEIRILTEGKVSIVADGDVTVTAAGEAVVLGNVVTRLGASDATDPVARKSDLQAIKSWADAHTHPGVGAPNAMPLPGCSANVKSV